MIVKSVAANRAAVASANATRANGLFTAEQAKRSAVAQARDTFRVRQAFRLNLAAAMSGLGSLLLSIIHPRTLAHLPSGGSIKLIFGQTSSDVGTIDVRQITFKLPGISAMARAER